MQITAFVAGASTGFGASITRRLAAGGARVVASARRGDRLSALVAEFDGLIHPHELDVRDGAAVAQAIAGMPTAFAGIDLLVNNAGLAKVSKGLIRPTSPAGTGCSTPQAATATPGRYGIPTGSGSLGGTPVPLGRRAASGVLRGRVGQGPDNVGRRHRVGVPVAGVGCRPGSGTHGAHRRPGTGPGHRRGELGRGTRQPTRCI